MKKTFAIILTLLYISVLFGCGQPSAVIPADSNNVVTDITTTTTTMHADTTTQATTTIESTTESTTGTTAESTTATTTKVTTTKATSTKTQTTTRPTTTTTKKTTQPYVEPTGAAAWVVNSSGQISLYKNAGSKVISKIPNGATVELLGWYNKYAKVNYKGTVGYVLANYIKPKDNSYFAENLDVVEITNVYSYDEMVKDIATLKEQYPDLVTVSSIGSSELGRDIPVICIGNMDAKYHVLMQGAIHAREHMTSWLLMAMSEYWLDHDISELSDVCYHIIPMVNPDGVILSQTQSLNDDQLQIYLSDTENGFTSSSQSAYASTWKANAMGVDLNRNFPSGWEYIDDRDAPSSELYRGTAPFSASETKALRDYTLMYDFDATISYHSTGSIIYYEYGEKEPVNSKSKSLGNAVNAVTGYNLIESNSIAGAGYKDWVIDELGIPSLTIEIGVSSVPLAFNEIYSIFVRNQQVLPAIAEWLTR